MTCQSGTFMSTTLNMSNRLAKKNRKLSHFISSLWMAPVSQSTVTILVSKVDFHFTMTVMKKTSVFSVLDLKPRDFPLMCDPKQLLMATS